MSRPVLRRYESRCELTFSENLTFLADCEISLSEDGDVNIECRIPSSNDFEKVNGIYQDRHLVYASIFGKDSQGFSVNVPQAYIREMQLNVSGGTAEYRLTLAPAQPLTVSRQKRIAQEAEVHYGLSNFYFGGCEATPTEKGWKLDKFRLKVQNLDLLFRQLDDYGHRIAILGQDGGIMPTSELVVTVQPNKLEELDKTVFDVLVLLSYATGSWIGVVYRDVLEGTELTESRFGASKMFPYRHFDFVIDARNLSGCQLRHFVELAFPNFVSLKETLSLDIVLEFAATAKLGSHLETKYLLTTVALETLASRIPDHMRELGITLQSGEVDIVRSKIAQVLNERGSDMSSQLIDEIASKVASKEIRLRDRLRALLNQYRIRYDPADLDFTRTRARLIHSGRFRDYTQAVTLYERLTDFVNRVLLSLLGCQGILYVNVAKGRTQQFVPPPME
jgi:hypothetical protein